MNYNTLDEAKKAILIGERIKGRREELSYTQKYLGSKLGLDKSTIQRYETGQVKHIKLPIIEAISKELDVHPHWLSLKSDIQKSFSDYETEKYGGDETIPLYKKLDTEDKAEIKGTIKQMLKAEKYNNRPIVKVAAHDGSTREVRDIPVTEMIKRELKKKSNKK